jgi:hypothetical protein
MLETKMTMKNNIRLIGFLTILITYIVVKIVDTLAGFHYDPFREGIINIKFLIDIISWGVVYAVIYTLLKRLLPPKNN